MSDFTSYEKMPESLKKWKLTPNERKQLEKVQWVVTEKVHGANFSFIYEDEKIHYGKRKAPLNWESDFFGFQLVAERLNETIQTLFEQISEDIDCRKCTIYGELCGGEYPHPDVVKEEKIQAIQTGIYYSPNIEFYAFDIAIEPNNEEEARYYLDYETALNYFEQADLLYAKPLFIGKINKAVEYDLEFQSVIPIALNLPPLVDNTAEGVVIKPMKHEHIGIRPILKIKHEQFKEEKKFHQSVKWSYVPEEMSKTDVLELLLPELQNFITKNRLDATASKFGRVDLNNEVLMGEIKTFFAEDVWESFTELNEDIVQELPQSTIVFIKRKLSKEVEVFCEKHG